MSKPPDSDFLKTDDQTIHMGSSNLGSAAVQKPDNTVHASPGPMTQSDVETITAPRPGAAPIDSTIVTGSGMADRSAPADSTIITGSGVLGSSQAGIEEINATVARSGSAMTAPVGRQTQAVSQSEGGMGIGELFQGKYEIIKLLGVGGMGRVYQARHIDLEKMVAIKVLNASMSQDREAIERFKREAKATAKVTHPNAVQVLDYGVEEDGNCFLVMEYLEGESLRDRIFKRKRIPLSQVVHFAEQVCYVLEVMHRKGITHRDLKPDNIFYQLQEGMEIIKVLDFGIAKVHPTATQAGSDLTREGMMIGTPRYMSPEQCQGLAIDGRSDLYSLTVVLFEMLSGQVPFDAENPFTIALKHINSPLPSLLDMAPDIQPAVAEVIHKALSKAPADRYQSAKELSQALCHAASVAPTIQMEMLAGSKEVDYATAPLKQNVDTPAQRDAITAGGTRPIKYMGGGTLPLGAEPATRPLPSFPLMKVAMVSVAVVAVVLGGLKFGGFLSPAVTPQPIPPIDSGTKDPLVGQGFVLIPTGTFQMGLDPGPNEYAVDQQGVPIKNAQIPLDETPAHTITVNPFYLSKYELTNEEYKQFVEANNGKYQPPKSWKNGNFPDGDGKLPVTNVSWDDAMAYCQWRTQTDKDGITYRLPTEEEWEFAARGPQGRIFPWGNQWNEDKANTNKLKTLSSPLDVNANVSKIINDKSPFDTYAMAGNVSEWTSSPFNLYSQSTFKPSEGDKKCKIYRGGSFNSVQAETRATARKWDLSNATHADVGFRIAANPPQNQTK